MHTHKYADGAVLMPQILHTKPNQLCIISGTLYKEMPLKPDVLKEYAKEVSTPPTHIPKKLSPFNENCFNV